MSAVKKSTVAGKKVSVRATPQAKAPVKPPAITPKTLTTRAKAQPKTKASTTPAKVQLAPRKSAPVKQPKARPPAKPAREQFLEDYKDAKLVLFGAKDDKQGEFKPGDKFVMPVWSWKLVEELATVALGRRTSKTNPLVHDAQFALLMIAIPAYIDRARHDNERRTTPYDGFNPDPQLIKGVADRISGLMLQGLHDEARVLSRALQRLQAIDETWNSPDFGNKRVLKAIAVLIDLALLGKTPTKLTLRKHIYGDDVAESQFSREIKRITGLRNLLRAKSGPKPGGVRGKRT